MKCHNIIYRMNNDVVIQHIKIHLCSNNIAKMNPQTRKLVRIMQKSENPPNNTDPTWFCFKPQLNKNSAEGVVAPARAKSQEPQSERSY